MENDRQQVDFMPIKEVKVGKDAMFKIILNDFQNSAINFCMNFNLFQNKENFSTLTMREQFEFNECVDYVGNKIKNDFKEMELFYLKCKENCKSKNAEFAEDIEESIKTYNGNYIGFMRPSLNPCVQDCVDLYQFLVRKYHKYMIKDSGIYLEYINYKEKLI